MKSLRYEGVWWLPSNPDKKIFGIREFPIVDRIILSTIGTFTQEIILDNIVDLT